MFLTNGRYDLCCYTCRGSAVGEVNVQGEDQKKLDVIANELFINMLRSSFEVFDSLSLMQSAKLVTMCWITSLLGFHGFQKPLKSQLMHNHTTYAINVSTADQDLT